MKLQTPYLKDILTAIDKIENVSGSVSFEVFIKDHKIHDAILYNFIIIGEAANRISEEFKSVNDSVEWHKLKGMRII